MRAERVGVRTICRPVLMARYVATPAETGRRAGSTRLRPIRAWDTRIHTSPPSRSPERYDVFKELKLFGVHLGSGMVTMLAVGCSGAPAIDAPSVSTSAVNGTTTSARDYPYAARVNFSGSGGQYLCSGSVVSPRVVLTAGHCASAAATVEAPYAPGGSQTKQSVKVVTAPDGSDVALYVFAEAEAFQLDEYPNRATQVPSSFDARLVGRRAHGPLTGDNLLVVSEVLHARVEAGTPYVLANLDTGYVAAEHGDSGGALFIDGTRQIAAVVHGGPDYTKGFDEYARIDRVGCWIANVIFANGGEGPSVDGTERSVDDYCRK